MKITRTYTVPIRKVAFTDEIDVEFEIEFDAEYEPARGMGGSWENSSPESSSIEITGIKALTKIPGTTAVEIEGWADENLTDRMEDDCWEYFMTVRNEGSYSE